jgi:hypothetical protein
VPRLRLEGFLSSSSLSTCRRVFARAALVLCPLLAACGGDTPQTITNVREGPRKTDFRPASTAERFGLMGNNNPHGGNPHGGMQMPGMPGMDQGSPGFEFTTPEGWQEKNPPGTMRAVDFRIGSSPDVECYLSVVQGGVAANVLRWRKQMGLEPITPAAVQGLPQSEFLGQGGTLVDLEGTFAGMGQSEPRTGYRMLGLIVDEPGRTVTLKMVGPSDEVVAEKENFLALAKSFRAAAAAASPMPSSPSGEEGGTPFAWDAPSEWEVRSGHQMRVVTYGPKDSPDTECYVFVLSGAGGGLEANVARWCQQMGQPPLDAAAIEALPTIKVFGRDAKLVEINGNYTDMQGNQSAESEMLGVICELPAALVTVKMTGPKDIVEREKERFVAFCGSLRVR